MRAHAAADDGAGPPEGRPPDAKSPQDGPDLTEHRPAADDRDALPDDRRGNTGAASAQPVNPLQRLIAGRLQERGWSYGEVARRSGLPRSTVYTLATTRNLVRPPRPATINGLAMGLDMPVSAVRAAAAESTGMHYYDEPPADPRPGVSADQERELLIASIDELSAEDRRHVAALVESLRNRPVPPSTDLTGLKSLGSPASSVKGVPRMADDELEWFSVRCVFAWSGWEGRPFEERITLWRARSLDHAIELAEREAGEYAAEHGFEYLQLSQAYEITEGSEIGHGTEGFSLLRDSDLAPDDYLDSFFSTGREHIQETTADDS